MISIANQASNTNIILLIKQICREERRSSKPADFVIGTVTKTNPLKIKVSSKITLDSDFFYVCESVDLKTIKKGDALAMLRAQGGQRYLVIDKVVTG